MHEKNSILAWVDSDNETKSLKFLKLLNNKLNLYLARLYIHEKNVHFSNNALFNSNNTITHNKKDSNTALQNKIMKLNPLFMLVAIDHNNVKYSKNLTNLIVIIKRLSIPLLVLPDSTTPKDLKHIITTLEFTNRSKERVVWANYWCKKFSAKIEALYPTEKDNYIVGDINENIYFAQKLFKQSKNRFQISNTNKVSKESIDDSIKLAEEKTDPILIISTGNISLLPSIFKPKELNILNKCRKIPVFLIPPNYDFTIPCH